MKNYNYILTTVLALLLISSCASLSDNQVESIKKYSTATKIYSDFPSIVVNDYLELQKAINNLSVSYEFDSNLSSDRIFNNAKNSNNTQQNLDELDLSFKILKKYSENLEKIATTDYSENSKSEKIGTGIDSLITIYNEKFNKKIKTGTGNVINEGISSLFSQFSKKKKAEVLKKSINSANPLIKELTDNIKSFLEKKVKEDWLSGIENSLKNNHKLMRKSSKTIVDNILIDKEVIKSYDEIYRIRKMNEELMKSIENVYTVHNSLKKNIVEKRKMKGILRDVSLFINDLKKVYDSTKK